GSNPSYLTYQRVNTKKKGNPFTPPPSWQRSRGEEAVSRPGGRRVQSPPRQARRGAQPSLETASKPRTTGARLREDRRPVVDRAQKGDQVRAIGRARHEVVPHTGRVPVGVLRAVQHLVQRRRQATVEVRRRLVQAQQRRNVEAVSPQRRDRLPRVGWAGPELVRA